MKAGSVLVGSGAVGTILTTALEMFAEEFEGPWGFWAVVAFAAMLIGFYVENQREQDGRGNNATGEYPIERVDRNERVWNGRRDVRGCAPPPLDVPYVGSQAALAELEERLIHAGPRTTVVVQAPRGSGATALALKFSEGRSGVWFATAVTSLNDFLEKIARAEYGIADLSGATAVDMGRVLVRGTRNPIIVLDNLDTPSVVRDINLLLTQVQILVTTSLMVQEWAVYDVMTLDPMTESDALELLSSVSQRPAGERAEARKLVRDLGCEPLAVRRVAEYMRTHKLSASDLRQWLAESPEDACRETSGGDPTAGIGHMLNARFDSADEVRFAMDLLRVIAVSGHKQITRGQILGLYIGDAPSREIDVALNALESRRLIQMKRQKDGERLLVISLLVRSVLVAANMFDRHRSPLALHRARRIARPLDLPDGGIGSPRG